MSMNESTGDPLGFFSNLRAQREDGRLFTIFRRPESPNAEIGPRAYAKRQLGIANRATAAEKVEIIRQLFRRGFGVRGTARLVGVSPNTAARYYPHGETIICQCGMDARHQGWCAWRVMQSPERQKFLRRWAYRSSGLLIQIDNNSLVQAAAITLRPSNIEGETVTHIDVLNAIKKHAAHLEDQLRDDLLQDMFLEVLENRTPLAELGMIIRDKVKAMRGEVSKFKFVSLDSIIPGTEDLRLIDTIESDRFHF
jgi:hypothetical protein